MAGVLEGHRIAIPAADGVERVELERPRQAMDDLPAFCERSVQKFAGAPQSADAGGAR